MEKGKGEEGGDGSEDRPGPDCGQRAGASGEVCPGESCQWNFDFIDDCVCGDGA